MTAEAQRRWRARHPEKSREVNARWRAANRHKSKEYVRTFASKNPDYYRDKDDLRRAREAGVEQEKFPRREIFERDGWVCQLCGGPIDSSLSHPEPQCASLDHVVPIARGGGHLRSNVQASHLLCNQKKGAREA